jgi:hypothetical protein
MSFSPNLFLSNINAKGGLSKPSRFEVILPIPPYIGSAIGNSVIEKILNFPNSIFTDVSDAINSALGTTNADGPMASSNPTVSRYLALQCETAELPGKSLETADVRIYGQPFKVPYRTQQTADTTLTFICTNDFYERKLFDRWMEAIIPPDTNNIRFPKSEASRFMTNIRIIQYDDVVRQIFAVDLIDAFPTAIAPQSLSWQDDGFHRLSVSFTYQRYRPIYEGNFDIGQTLSTLGATGISTLTRGLGF